MLSAMRNAAFRGYLNYFFPTTFSAASSRRQQELIFNKHVRQLSYTELGKDAGLNKVRTYYDFRKSIPLTGYDFYESYLERIKGGKENVMTRHRVKWLAKTAGTTSGKSKLIPITAEVIRRNHVRGVFFGLSMIHRHHTGFNLLNHKTLMIPGGIYDTLSPSGLVVGDISAIMAMNVPYLYRSFYTPDLHTQIHPEWEVKVKRTAEQALKEDVGTISGVPTWHLALIKKMKELEPFDKLTDVWKNLQLFIHGGVSFEPYRQVFEDQTGRKDFIFYEVYNATEGFFGIQRHRKAGDLLLLTDSDIFYEFIPFGCDIKDASKAVPLWEVKTEVPYTMLLTTSNGLVRYVIGDVITFTDLNPYSFRISGRTQEYINAFGEDLLLTHVEQALIKTAQRQPCSIRDFTVAPYYIHVSSNGRMQFLIEFSSPPADLKQFEKALDEALKAENYNYAQKRQNDLALNNLQVIAVPDGTFQKWLASKGKLGGQNKVPRLVNGRSVIEEILQLDPTLCI